MVLAAKDVKDGEVDAMLSAGNTGALLAAGFFIVGRIKGVERPGLMSTLPTVDGRGYDMLDLGANAENTPEHLHQYAVMGSYYAENVRGIQKPRVGLLNNGTEASKEILCARKLTNCYLRMSRFILLETWKRVT